MLASVLVAFAASSAHATAATAVPVVPILHRGDRFIVVAKPAGLVVHRNEFSRRSSVALLQLVRDQVGMRMNPVHRLDAGTSGCLFFAEDTQTTAMLQAALSSEHAQKTYYAFSRGDASRFALRRVIPDVAPLFESVCVFAAVYCTHAAPRRDRFPAEE